MCDNDQIWDNLSQHTFQWISFYFRLFYLVYLPFGKIENSPIHTKIIHSLKFIGFRLVYRSEWKYFCNIICCICFGAHEYAISALESSTNELIKHSNVCDVNRQTRRSVMCERCKETRNIYKEWQSTNNEIENRMANTNTNPKKCIVKFLLKSLQVQKVCVFFLFCGAHMPSFAIMTLVFLCYC